MATKKPTKTRKRGKTLGRSKSLKKVKTLTTTQSLVSWGDIKGGSTDDKHKDWIEVS